MILLNGTLPFALGADLRSWTYSTPKDILVHLIIYGGLFLVAPLILTKGIQIVRQPDFLIPLLVAVLAIALRPLLRPTPIIAIAVIVYLHWRFDLSQLGIRSTGWPGDLLAILIIGALSLAATLLQPAAHSLLPGTALASMLERLFTNPAATVENLFYFGFLGERLSAKIGRWTAPLIGLMYTLHEMSNLEYWYESAPFGLIFVGITLWAAIYLWRRSLVVIWLGDGFHRYLQSLL